MALRDKDRLSWNVIAKQLGVGATTVQRAYRQAKEDDSAFQDSDRNDRTKEPIDGEPPSALT